MKMGIEKLQLHKSSFFKVFETPHETPRMKKEAAFVEYANETAR